MVKNLLTNLIIITSVISFITSCAGIPGNKIKLADYPKISQSNKALTLHYDYDKTRDIVNNTPYNSGTEFDLFYSNYVGKDGRVSYCRDIDFNYDQARKNLKTDEQQVCYTRFLYDLKFRPYFDYKIIQKLKSQIPDVSYAEKDANGCIVKIKSEKTLGTCPITNLISPLTLTILPYYCQHIYEARATLIHRYQKPATNLSNKTSKNSPNPNPIEEKVLKEYYLKDKVHEVWSAVWFLTWFIYNPKSVGTPEGAKKLVEQNISEALARQIIHDTSQFEECRKN